MDIYRTKRDGQIGRQEDRQTETDRDRDRGRINVSAISTIHEQNLCAAEL